MNPKLSLDAYYVNCKKNNHTQELEKMFLLNHGKTKHMKLNLNQI